MPLDLQNYREALAFEAIDDLYTWGTNFDYEQNPFLDFLDLIGFSKEQYGQNCHTDSDLSYADLEYIADALKEYVTRPQDATDFINLLLEEESK